MSNSKQELIGYSYNQLKEFITNINEKKYRVQQMWQWIYYYGVTDFSLMSNISKSSRNILENHLQISRPKIKEEYKSNDGTYKWLVEFSDGNIVETVFIPEEKRGTLCISSQIGCTLNCKFCHTGTQAMVRNLTSYEIIGQILIAKDRLNDWPFRPEINNITNNNVSNSVNNDNANNHKAKIANNHQTEDNHSTHKNNSQNNTDSRLITNIVFMGMGEPLYNYDNVKTACNIMTHNEGLALSKRKVTVSTSGIVPYIKQLGEDTGVSLAVSLHATTDDVRNQIMAINKKYNIKELLNACKNYPPIQNKSRRITFEYVMLKNINDSTEDAYRLIKLLKNIPAKINLIPFNPWSNSKFECSPYDIIENFAKTLYDHGIVAPIRKTRGDDILAACGQLKSSSERKKRNYQNVTNS